MRTQWLHVKGHALHVTKRHSQFRFHPNLGVLATGFCSQIHGFQLALGVTFGGVDGRREAERHGKMHPSSELRVESNQGDSYSPNSISPLELTEPRGFWF